MSFKVLIVDDSRVERHYLSGLLKRLGAETDAAECCDAGVEKACTNEYDMLFIDYFMPESDGVHTLNEIRCADGSLNAAVPAIALGTADPFSGDDFFLEQGFTNYIEKPIDHELLHAALLLYLPPEKRGEVVRSEAASQPGREEQGSALDGYDWLNEIQELSVADGLKNCGSEEGYLSALEIFYNSIPSMSDEIEGYYTGGDWKSYTIKVHALKSSARIIGLAGLSEQARLLEAAGDGEDMDYINAHTAEMLELYRSYRDKLGRLGGGEGEKNDDEKPAAEPDFLEDAFSSLDEFAGQMDYDLVEMVISSLEEYRLEPEDKAIFDEVNRAFMELDWNGIRSASQKYISRIYGSGGNDQSGGQG